MSGCLRHDCWKLEQSLLSAVGLNGWVVVQTVGDDVLLVLLLKKARFNTIPFAKPMDPAIKVILSHFSI